MRRLFVLAFALAAAWDLSRPPAAQWSAAAAIGGIHVYQRTLSPVLEHAGSRCRFTVSCSRYAETVIRKDGILKGGWRAVARVARCGPWTPAGTVDHP